MENGANILNLTDRFGNTDSPPDNLMLLPDFMKSFHNFSSSSSSSFSSSSSSSSSAFSSSFTSRSKREASELVQPEILTGTDGKKRKVVTMVNMSIVVKEYVIEHLTI